MESDRQVHGPPANDEKPRTASALASAQARAAWDRGRAAMEAGHFDEARRWFGRASRLAPSDITPQFSLASACLAAGRTAEAAELFEAVAGPADAPVAWLGAASAHARDGRWARAATCLQQALSRYAAAGPADFSLADAVATGAGRPGWCGLDQSGHLVVRTAHHPTIRVDGRVVPGFVAGSRPTAACARITVAAGGRALLGSPIDVAAIRRLEGVVQPDGQGGLVGWAWHPGDPDRDPVLALAAGGASRTIRPADRSVAALRPLAQPRGFRLGADDLAGSEGSIAVRGPDGTDLIGSPVHPNVSTPPRRSRRTGRSLPPTSCPACPDRPVAIVVPVYRGARETLACLRDVHATVPVGTAVIVVDDGSPEPALVKALATLVEASAVELLRHDRNRGFPAAANTGLRAALRLDPPRDLVLLNSDTRLAPGWLDRLRASVQGNAAVGTATPLSNDGSIASYPDPAGGNAAPTARDLVRLSRQAALANDGTVVDVPTGVGFCLYVRHECLKQTGLLREDVFAQGYGEENDFCLRASALGWRHVIVPGAYVAHAGARSFGAAREALLKRNLRVLERLHPGYGAEIAGWIGRDPLAPSRRRLDLLRWARGGGRSVLLVTHDHGGGVERCVRERVASLRAAGDRPVVLRPVLDRRETEEASGRRTLPGLIRLEEGETPDAFPNLVFRWDTERADLLEALRLIRPRAMEVHHLLGHERSVLDLAPDLGIPYELRLHDYAAFCPRITLSAEADRYCGEPDLAGCEACVATRGGLLDEAITPSALRVRSKAEFARARRVVVPSVDMCVRVRRHFPGVAITVVPHESDPVGPLAAIAPGSEVRVLVVGAIGRVKGYDVLLACARDAADRGLSLRFVVVGRTIDDEALLDTGCAEVTGPYREGQAGALIAEQSAHIAFVPSLWPETWCFALGEALGAGLPVAAFDLGAQAERIRRTGRGWLLPLGAPPTAINRFLLRPPPLAVQSSVMHTGCDWEMTPTQPLSESHP